MLSSFWVASTKPGAALARVKGSLQPLQARGWFLAPRDRGAEAVVHCLRRHEPGRPLAAATSSLMLRTLRKSSTSSSSSGTLTENSRSIANRSSTSASESM